MATNTDIPQGYKATALGIIPQEWEAMRLSDVCTLINGRAYKQNELLSKGKYKILRVGNFFTNDSWYFSDMELDPNKYAYKGDLLYAWSASFGPRFWTGDKVIYHYHIWKICNLKGINQQYLYFFLDYDASLLQRDTQGGTMHHITKENMEKRFIPVPPLAEQRKIAEVLGVWDKAIEKQARLIEKLALRKRALMQRLLSAKLRLPGFSEPWKKVKLGDVAELYQPQTIQSEDLSQTGYPVYGANGLIGYYNNYNHEYPQVVITCRGSSCGTVNFTPGKCWITGNAMVLNVDNNRDVNKSFFYYLISNSSFVNLISGSGQPQIVRQPLLKFELRIPPLKEQTAIAEVLTAADREIDLAKEKLERLRRQKRGLMQQLLTGKKRI